MNPEPPPAEGPGPGGLPADAEPQIERLLSILAADPTAPTSVADPERARAVHIADSASGLEFGPLRSAGRICDLGAGAGFPGLVLAIALPGTQVDLLEATGRKCEFMARVIDELGLDNARVVHDRAESWGSGSGAEIYDVVTARAVARLATLAELASPLLVDGGHLIAWKGRRDADEEAESERASAATAVAPREVRWVGPYAGSENRHLHLLQKTGPTPQNLPRRPGMAKKRPLGR